MQLSSRHREILDDLINLVEDILALRGADQVMAISDMSREFAQLTAQDPGLGAAAALFKTIADKDQAERDEYLTIFIEETRKQRNQ